MCIFKRTVYTICAHSVDEKQLGCLRKKIKGKLHLTSPTRGCLGLHSGNAHLKLGWCPSCEDRLVNATQHGHYRAIDPRDKHVIRNFWAWRSQEPEFGIRDYPSHELPLALLDGDVPLQYNKTNKTYTWPEETESIFYDERLRSPQAEILSTASFIDDVMDGFALPLLSRHTGEDGIKGVASENYHVWFSLFEFHPKKLYNDPEAPLQGDDHTCDSASQMVAMAVGQTLMWYGKDIKR